MRKVLLTIASLFVSIAIFSQEEEKKIDWTRPFTERIDVHGYEQAGYNYKDVNGYATNTFQLYRTLLWVNCRITERWSFRVMHDFSSELQDAYTDYKVADALTIRVGQFKNNFTLENPLSPTSLELIDVYAQSVAYLSGCGGDALYGTRYGRDLGMELYGNLLKNHIIYYVDILNGQGINRKDGNKYKDVIMKLEFHPIEGLNIVGSAQIGKGHAVDSSVFNEISAGENYKRNRVSFGGEFKSNHFNVRSEYLQGIDGDVISRGAYCTLKVPVCKVVDAVASIDYFDKNTDLHREQTNYTLGFQYWYFKKCRVQLQYTRCCLGYGKDYNSIQSQIQIAF